MKETGEGNCTGRDLNFLQNMLLLMGDFLKYCDAMSEKTPTGSVNPLIPILNEMWPFIVLLLNHFLHNDDIVEYSIRLVKHFIRATGN